MNHKYFLSYRIQPVSFLKQDFIYLFLERGKGKEKEEEKHQWIASNTPLTGDLASNPGMCPDVEPNQ